MADAPEANPCCVATQRQVERLKAEVAALAATAAMLESLNLATSYDRDDQIAALLARAEKAERERDEYLRGREEWVAKFSAERTRALKAEEEVAFLGREMARNGQYHSTINNGLCSRLEAAEARENALNAEAWKLQNERDAAAARAEAAEAALKQIGADVEAFPAMRARAEKAEAGRETAESQARLIDDKAMEWKAQRDALAVALRTLVEFPPHLLASGNDVGAWHLAWRKALEEGRAALAEVGR